MHDLTQNEVRARLNADAVPMQKIEEIVKAFDFRQAVYEQRFDVGTTLYQYVRNASNDQMSPRTGHWFCLRGAEQGGLAIFGGVAGRQLTSFSVRTPFNALEGTASRLVRNWSWEGGGKGGSTQVFVATKYLGRLIAIGPCDHW